MTIRLLQGDCRLLLKTLKAKSIHTCVSSPPYFGLRDYGTASWQGGDPACDHVVGEIRTGLGMAKLSEKHRGGGKKASEPKPMTAKAQCPRCGAIRVDNQIGLEPTPEEFIAEMVAVYREVHRVLRDDGTIWLNLGDSYAFGGSGSRDEERWPKQSRNNRGASIHAKKHTGLKIKDMIGIPWRVALALQADGWYLRQDIIWSKPNPMPESVQDRCTKSHEYIFLLSKSPRYYFDAKAIAEPLAAASTARLAQNVEAQQGSKRAVGKINGNMKAVIRRPSGWKSSPEYKDQDPRYKKSKNPHATSYAEQDEEASLRNKRTVWNVATIPFKDAHFATFPPALIEPCILAGAPVDGMVLDPFAGAGTTGFVAERLGRNSTLIELNPEYAAIAKKRIKKDRGLFTDVSEQ